MKYLKIGKNGLSATAIIAFAAGLRILLIALNWPPTNSDEGVMGIIALHIAYTGFFIVMYLLTCLLFSKKLALITLALLSVGSIAYLSRQTLATGGSAETLLFGSLSLLNAPCRALPLSFKYTLMGEMAICVYFR